MSPPNLKMTKANTVIHKPAKYDLTDDFLDLEERKYTTKVDFIYMYASPLMRYVDKNLIPSDQINF